MHHRFKPSKLLNNYIAFQVGWLACAFLHNSYAVFIVAALLVWLYLAEPWSKVRMALTVQIAVAGISMDIILTYLGVYEFSSSLTILPMWLCLLWFLFASTLSVSLSWMMNSKVLSFLGGVVIGPVAYWGGVQFDAFTIRDSNDYLIIAIAWGLAMSLFGFLHRTQPNNRVILKHVGD